MMNKRILDLAIPNIISNITIPLLGLVDLILMGHKESDSYIGAIALGTLIFNFIYWGFGYLRMGTTGFTAQARGRKDLPETIHIFFRAMLLALIFGVSLIVLQGPIEFLGFIILDGEPEVETLATSYFSIRIWAAPAVLMNFVFLGWFIGMQNAKIPLLVALVTNIANIAFDTLFVLYFDFGANGVAFGTVIAQYSGLLVSIIFFRKIFGKLLKHYSYNAIMQFSKFKEFMLVNSNIFIRTMCLVLVFSFFTAKSASSDANGTGNETILAVNSLLMQFFIFFSFVADGFAYAAEALIGRFVGSRDKVSLKKSLRLLFLWGLSISCLFTLIYFVSNKAIIGLLTNIQELRDNVKPYLFWVVLIPLTSFVAFLWDGIFIGATAGKQMRISMLVSTILVFFPAYLILNYLMGNHGLWLAFILFMVSRGVTMTILAPKAVYSKIN